MSNSSKKRGFYYRVPQAARFEVFVDENIRTGGVIPIAQFGVVTTLPSRKKVKAIVFDTRAGGVRLISY